MSKKQTAALLDMLSPHAQEIIHDALHEALKELFTSALKERASRLVLVDDDGRDMGGWTLPAALKHLTDSLGLEVKPPYPCGTSPTASALSVASPGTSTRPTVIGMGSTIV